MAQPRPLRFRPRLLPVPRPPPAATPAPAPPAGLRCRPKDLGVGPGTRWLAWRARRVAAGGPKIPVLVSQATARP